MGVVFTLSGPSGVGKTTFLNLINASKKQMSLEFIPRYANRPIRDGEIEGFEYFFISSNTMLDKVFNNDFIHFEKWGDYYSAIETSSIDRIINSKNNGLILASAFGTSRLQATYKDKIIPIYMWPGSYETLYTPSCLSPFSNEVLELKWRIRKKLVDDGFSEYEKASLSNNEFLDKRMIDNYLDIAAINGKFKAGENIFVLSNFHNKEIETVEIFRKMYNKTSGL